MPRAPWGLFCVAGLAAATAYAISDSAIVEAAAMLGVSLGALVATMRRALGANGAPTVWWLLTAAAGLWVLGWVPWQVSVLQTGEPPAAFSAAHGLFLGSTGMLTVALLALVRSREPDRGAGIESALLGIVLGLVSWILLLEPAFERGDLEGAGGAIQLLYALLDVAVVATVVRALLSGTPNPSQRLLLAGSISLVVANTIWNHSALTDASAGGDYVGLGWLLYSAIVGAAALHPAAVDLGGATGATPRSHIRQRLPVLLAAGLSVPALGAAELLFAVEIDTPLVVLGSVVLSTLVLLRAGKLLLESERLRADLARHNEELTELDRLKDDFVASVSHELRTPLTSIRGYLELVLEEEAGKLTEEQRSYLDVVDRNAVRLLRVVGDLLFVAQLNAGSLPLAETDVDPRELVVQAADSARPTAVDRGVDLSLELGDLPPVVRGDASRLAQALDNLVANAIKFTPAGGRVSLQARRTGEAVELSVADTGPGIAPADHARLFDRFFRTASASSGAVQGAGLGLAITKAIVEAHGGTVSVQSELGAGAVFRILLPATA